MKKAISIFIEFCVIVTMFGMGSLSVNADTAGKISVSSATGREGNTVMLTISISDNPGIVALRLFLNYNSDVLVLTGLTDGGLLGTNTYTFGNDLSTNPYAMLWDMTLSSNQTGNGTLVTAAFQIKDGAPAGNSEVSVSVDQGSTFNYNFDDVHFVTESGYVTVEGESPETGNPTITVGSVSGTAGSEIAVPIIMEYNPGLVALRFGITYDSDTLSLTGATDGGLLGTDTAVFGNVYTGNPYYLLWEDTLTPSNHTDNGVIATLTFRVLNTASAGTTSIGIVLDAGSTFNRDLNDVGFETAGGTITIESAHYNNSPTLSVNSVVGKAGGTVNVVISISDNPGIVALRLFVSYDKEKMLLINADNGEVFEDNVATFGNEYIENPYVLLWEDSLAGTNNSANGILATLIFRIMPTAQAGDTPITVSYDTGSTFDINLSNVAFNTENGAVMVNRLSVTQVGGILSNATIYTENTIHLEAKYTYDGAAAENVTWESSNLAIADVSESGSVIGKKLGRATISAYDTDGCVGYFNIMVLNGDPVIRISNNSGSYSQKVNWWKRYSTATMMLSYQAYNCNNAARYEWSSSNVKVKVDQSGNITNTGSFARSATITLTAYDAEENIIAKNSVKVSFYKFNWQKSKVQSQSVLGDNWFGQNLSTQELNKIETERANNPTLDWLYTTLDLLSNMVIYILVRQ